MRRTDVFQIRIEPELRDRLARLRDERHVNPGAWARDVIAAALDRELPADLEAPKRQPLAGWKPCKLGDGWGAVLDGPVSPRSRRTRAPRRSASRTAGGIDRDQAEVIADATAKLAEQGDQTSQPPS